MTEIIAKNVLLTVCDFNPQNLNLPLNFNDFNNPFKLSLDLNNLSQQHNKIIDLQWWDNKDYHDTSIYDEYDDIKLLRPSYSKTHNSQFVGYHSIVVSYTLIENDMGVIFTTPKGCKIKVKYDDIKQQSHGEQNYIIHKNIKEFKVNGLE